MREDEREFGSGEGSTAGTGEAEDVGGIGEEPGSASGGEEREREPLEDQERDGADRPGDLGGGVRAGGTAGGTTGGGIGGEGQIGAGVGAGLDLGGGESGLGGGERDLGGGGDLGGDMGPVADDDEELPEDADLA